MTPSRTRRGALTALFLAASLLTGCGSSKNAPDAEAPTKKVPSTDAGGETSGIALTDINGTTTLEEPAVKVVALEWTYVEDLLALGITPVGVADVPGYGQWVRAEPALPEGVEDVGSRQEPSIERIRRLKPDLIITSAPREGSNADDLADIAPVLAFDAYPTDGTSQWDEMQETFTTIGKAVGKEDVAKQVLEDLDAKIAEGKQTLADADLSSRTVVLAQGEGTPDAPMFRLFTDNAMVMQVVEDLGLENGWGGAEESYGFNSVSFEGLTAIDEDAWFLPVAPDDALDQFQEKYGDSPIWTNLGFVKADRVRPLGNDVWFFGGPLSADYLVDKILAALDA